jgi:hypothetical protein
MQAVQRKWNLARLRYRKQLQREFWIRRNELGITLACPQIRGSNGVSRGGSRCPPQFRWGPAIAGQAQEDADIGRQPGIDLAAAAALRGRMKGSNDHVSGLDYCPNLDHLEQVGKPSIKKEGQRRRVQDDQWSNSLSAEELKIHPAGSTVDTDPRGTGCPIRARGTVTGHFRGRATTQRA